MSKSADLEGALARIHDLEQIDTKKDTNITELKKMIKMIKVKLESKKGLQSKMC